MSFSAFAGIALEDNYKTIVRDELFDKIERIKTAEATDEAREKVFFDFIYYEYKQAGEENLRLNEIFIQRRREGFQWAFLGLILNFIAALTFAILKA